MTRQRMDRKLSFVDFSLDQLLERIATGQQKLNGGKPRDRSFFDFFEAVLTGKPSEDSKPIASRTLVFWIKAFNSWVNMRSSPKDAPPDVVNFSQLQDMLNIRPAAELHKVIKVFDPSGSRRLQSEGNTSNSLSRIQVPARHLMVTGVVLSMLISESNKLKFCMSLFDEDDTGALNKKQFSDLMWTLNSGLAKVFCVKPPQVDGTMHHVTATFNRIAREATQRLLGLAGESAGSKQAIIQAIKKRQSISPASPSAAAAAASPRKSLLEHTVPISVLEDVLLSSTSDPAYLLSGLVRARFAAERIVGACPTFVEDFETLAYHTKLPLPKEPVLLHSSDLPTHAEVIFVRDIFPHTGCGSIQHLEQIEHYMEHSPMFKFVSTDFRIRLVQKVHRSDKEILKKGGCLGLVQKMYPKALPRHFALFQQWCEEHDQLELKQLRSSEAADAFNHYRDHHNKSIIPMHELEVIKNEFAKLDYAGLGSVEYDVILEYIGSSSQTNATFIDLDSDAHVSLAKFCQMMCPPEYRLPEMSNASARIFGSLLESIAEEEKQSLTKSQALFEEARPTGVNSGAALKFGEHFAVSVSKHMLPPVPDDVWIIWQESFRELDLNGDGVVAVDELLIANCLPEPVCRYICRILDPHLENSFTMETFTAAMLHAHGYSKNY